MATKKPRAKKAPASNKRQTAHLRIVSLFAGAGGLDIAFCETGAVSEMFSTDSQSVFLQTVVDNLPTHFPKVRHSHLVVDARTLVASEVLNAIASPIDLVIGGPPCDDFTTYGLKRGMDGEKGPIIFEFARLVGELKPRAFLFENVPSLRGMCSQGFEELLKRLSAHGYSVAHQTLSACDFGAPTVRQRIFVGGFKNGLGNGAFNFPTKTHGETTQSDLFDSQSTALPFVTVKDVLADLPDVEGQKSAKYLNHTGRVHRTETIRHMMTVPQGAATSKSFRYRLPLDGLSRSLTAGTDNSTKAYLHPIYHREMSVREYARIHGFPDTWVFSGTRDNGIKQVANAVPIPLGRAVAGSLLNCLSKNKKK
jgi:DNA (cytosine-5)-methyltransferase 1